MVWYRNWNCENLAISMNCLSNNCLMFVWLITKKLYVYLFFRLILEFNFFSIDSLWQFKDFKTFIDIILALENRKEIQSQHFFFTILDINHCHYLDDYVLRYFFKAIENQMRRQGQEPIRFDDFSNEIYDMIRPQKHSRRIYFDDLVARLFSLINILIVSNGF